MNFIEQTYYNKYLHYKQKYLNLQSLIASYTKNQSGGTKCLDNNNGFHQKKSECWHDTLLMIILFSNFEENKILFGDEEQYINPIQQKLLDHSFILNEFIYDDREYNSFLLPINFNLDEKQKFNDHGLNYIEAIYERLINILDETRPPTLKRQISHQNTFKGIDYIYQVYNHQTFYLREYKRKKNNLGDYFTALSIVNIFNYYFFKNKFINIYNISKNNIYLLDMLSNKNIIGVILTSSMKINNDNESINHVTALYKCNNIYFFYDNEGNLINDGVSIKFDWSNFDIFKNFEELYNSISLLYKNQETTDYYYISELHFLYMDEFKSDNEYIDKIKHNFIYYMEIYYNNRFNSYLESKFSEIYNNINVYDNSYLILSCEKNNIEYVKLLLSYPDININQQNNKRNSALIHACSNQNEDIVKLLLENKNIDISLFNNVGDTALIITCWHNNLNIFNLLLPFIKKDDINFKNNNFDTALSLSKDKITKELQKIIFTS